MLRERQVADARFERHGMLFRCHFSQQPFRLRPSFWPFQIGRSKLHILHYRKIFCQLGMLECDCHADPAQPFRSATRNA